MSQIFTESAADLHGVTTLTGNSGGAVGASAGNINVVGSGAIIVTGSPGTNTLTVSTSSEGLMWSAIGASQALVVGHGYFCTTGAALSLSLPATSAIGDMIEISLDGSTSFSITQGAGQQVRFGILQTTSGAGGSITSTEAGDSIRMVCSVANLKWNVLSSIGNLIIV